MDIYEYKKNLTLNNGSESGERWSSLINSKAFSQNIFLT